MLIDSTYFQFQLSVPKDTATQQAMLNNYITKVEKQTLLDALGADLYDAFITGLAEPAPLQKWLNLRDGANFTVTDYNGNTRTIKWNGLINVEKESLLAYFTYYNLVKDSVANFGTGGSVYTDDSENKSKLPSRHLLVERFNQGLILYGIVPPEYDSSIVTVNDSAMAYASYYNWMIAPSLFNFIYYANLADATIYPNWEFTQKRRLNILGI